MFSEKTFSLEVYLYNVHVCPYILAFLDPRFYDGLGDGKKASYSFLAIYCEGTYPVN